MDHPTFLACEPLEPRRLMAADAAGAVTDGGDMVLRWNDVAMEVLRADRTLPGPGWSSRSLAMTSLAVFDAVNSVDGSYEPYLLRVRGHDRRTTSVDAAVASAAHEVLAAIYPAQKPMLDAALADSLAAVPDGSRETRGVALGEATAAAILAARADDGSGDVVDYTVNPAPGHWSPDPYNPAQIAWGSGWGDVEPFAIESAEQVGVPPPPALNSLAYALAYNEVKSLGAKDSTTRTADQTQVAVFWAYDAGGTGSPPGMYCQQVAVIAKQERNTLVENARLFALVNMAQADAGIASWHSKYEYDFWRPVTAIHRGDEDGNPLTRADPAWQPLGAPGFGDETDFTPPFPAYVSGHATFGAAVYRVLADYYQTDRVRFTLHSDEMPGVTRSFKRFSQAADENARSRIYMGVHWNFDDAMGQRMGRRVADITFDDELEPVRRVGTRDGSSARDLLGGVSLAASPDGSPETSAASLAGLITLEEEADGVPLA